VSSVLVRPAVPADFDRVAALTLAAYRALGDITDESGYTRVLADVADRARAAEVLVAEEVESPERGRRIVGTVTFVRPGSAYAELCGPDEAEFRMLAVDPRAQRRGTGEALVRACIDRARAAGARAIRLSTSPVMVVAQRIYERLGFVHTPERDWTPVAGVDLLAFRLDLRGSADEVEGDAERGRPALLIGDPRVPQDEPAGVQGEDRQR
jgi:ribosomal protein S18 acetylase RimI-like enzyme